MNNKQAQKIMEDILVANFCKSSSFPESIVNASDTVIDGYEPRGSYSMGGLVQTPTYDKDTVGEMLCVFLEKYILATENNQGGKFEPSVATEDQSGNRNPTTKSSSQEEVPEEIKQKIEAEANHYNEGWGTDKADIDFKAGAEYGYKLFQQENERLKRLLESLTPGGSEFVNDPERCAAFVKDQITGIPKSILFFKERADYWEKMWDIKCEDFSLLQAELSSLNKRIISLQEREHELMLKGHTPSQDAEQQSA